MPRLSSTLLLFRPLLQRMANPSLLVIYSLKQWDAKIKPQSFLVMSLGQVQNGFVLSPNFLAIIPT